MSRPTKLFAQNGYLNLKLLALVVLSIVLMSLNHQQAHLKTLRTVLSYIVSPAQYITNWPTKMLGWVEESFSSKQKLLAENEDLRADVLLLRAKLQKSLLLEHQNSQLRALLNSSEKSDDKVLVSQLLAVDPDPFAQQVIINKGSKEKLYLGQPVLDGYGVFGQVVQLGTFTSRVMLVTDTRSAVPVQDSRSGIRGVVVGLGASRDLSLVDMPTTADIKVGDKLVTSGLGEKFPVGYPIGTIVSIVKSPGNQFATVRVNPSAHLYQGHLVLLIWPQVKQLKALERKALRFSDVSQLPSISFSQKNKRGHS